MPHYYLIVATFTELELGKYFKDYIGLYNIKIFKNLKNDQGNETDHPKRDWLMQTSEISKHVNKSVI